MLKQLLGHIQIGTSIATPVPTLHVVATMDLSSNLDLPVSIPVDYMHAVLEGVVRTMMRFWFDSRYHGLPCYIGRSVSQIDSMLVKQRPPSESNVALGYASGIYPLLMKQN